jgi:hypothetical protein
MIKIYDAINFIYRVIASGIRGAFWAIKNDPAKRRIAAVVLTVLVLALVLWIDGCDRHGGAQWQYVRPYQFYR